MKVFNESFRLFTLFLICPDDNTANCWIKLRNISCSIFSLFYFVEMTVSSILFVRQYPTIDMAEAVYAVIQTDTSLVAACTFVTGYLQRKRIQNTFAAFQCFYDSSKWLDSSNLQIYQLGNIREEIRPDHSFHFDIFSDKDGDSSKFMDEANQRGNLIVKSIVNLFLVALVMTVFMMCGISVIYSIFKCGGIDSQYLFNPFKVM